jgi:beta-galactosidase
MADIFDITRRDFIRTSALLTAGTALANGAELPQETAAAHPSAPVFPYVAVYFRKTNPPPEDWARDHQTAAQTGMNIFRHWFMWSAIEVAPGKYDWSDYDRIMDLAAKYRVTNQGKISGGSKRLRWTAGESRSMLAHGMRR